MNFVKANNLRRFWDYFMNGNRFCIIHFVKKICWFLVLFKGRTFVFPSVTRTDWNSKLAPKQPTQQCESRAGIAFKSDIGPGNFRSPLHIVPFASTASLFFDTGLSQFPLACTSFLPHTHSLFPSFTSTSSRVHAPGLKSMDCNNVSNL